VPADKRVAILSYRVNCIPFTGYQPVLLQSWSLALNFVCMGICPSRQSNQSSIAHTSIGASRPPAVQTTIGASRRLRLSVRRVIVLLRLRRVWSRLFTIGNRGTVTQVAARRALEPIIKKYALVFAHLERVKGKLQYK
jgi:hypothetical protein